MTINKEEARKIFISTYGVEPQVIRAPGRINIIGEHTDYNDGFVLPAAIDLAAYFYIQKSNSNEINLVSLDFSETHGLNINDPIQPVEFDWVNYLLGVIDQFNIAGHKLEGFNLMFHSTIPMGAGLSSSAALECGFAWALNELFDLDIDPISIALMSQSAEHKFAGVQCGIMDQFASCMGKEGHVIKLDCRNLSYEYYPADFKDYEIILFDSKVKHNLTDTEYNVRHAQCKEGVASIQKIKPSVKSLRDASLEDLQVARKLMDEIVYRRCKYVITENLRVQQVCEALMIGDIITVGALMKETHLGLKDDYQVSCKELDTLIEIASTCNGFIGGRMMGGGFGGCTINLILKSKVDEVIDHTLRIYKNITGIEAMCYRVSISEGVSNRTLEFNNEI
ncbi:MAG: galactokinase [Reichenbachiella sp.]|uniref:galactokinase n=1 Tax=Reichenbachiella sp. TaxID=2184521 RepID=UPI003265ECEA